ncbi:MAG TPA: PqqD family protein, partial [Candidatus Methanoperedens sp.]|nr:PqqD family protein [Candidatus Methanoperedens sp.]
ESFGVRRIIKDDSLDLSLWYEYEVARGMSKRETDELIQEFYSRLSLQYRDLPIWSNLDREHLFLYISRYRRKKNAVPGLNELIDRIHSMRSKSRPTLIDTGNIDPYPRLNEGVFIGSFNFNLGLLIHTMMAGDGLNYSLKKERTNVLFDTNSNRILTVSDFGKDIVHWSNGQLNLSEIINFIKEKYGISYAEAEIKCRNFLSGLLEKDIVTY